MGAVFLLFLIPVGGGIPAGVLLARAQGLAWPLTAALYAASDVVQALLFEPILRGLVRLGARIPFPERFRAAWREARARTAEPLRGSPAGPAALVLISFGMDPMTGRASALAAGYGPVLGWVFAIAGDLLYYAVVAFATLRLSDRVKNPETAVALVLTAMVVLPLVFRSLRARFARAS